MRDDIRSLFINYQALFPEESSLFVLLNQQFGQQADIGSRKNFTGHVTASGLLINKQGEVLVIFHKFLQKYLQPGGHIESADKDLLAVAAREIREETGITDIILHDCYKLNNSPVIIDTHYIPANPKKGELEHYHHDFMFIFTTSQKKVVLDNKEVIEFTWLRAEELLKDNDSSLSRALVKVKRLELMK